QVTFSAAICRIKLPQILWQTRSSGRLRLPAPEQPESFAMPTDGCIRLDIHQRTAPREHATERRHHPTGGILGSSWFDFALLAEHQLLRKKRFSAAKARRECAARKAKPSRSTTNKEAVRKQCATVRINRKPGMNAQDDTLQNVTGSRFQNGRTSAEHR